MIHHLSIGSRDVTRAKRFYDATLGTLGYQCLSNDPGALGYGQADIDFWVLASSDPVPPNPGSGLHVCFVAPDRSSVQQFHEAALRHGGTDNGSPGTRDAYGPGYYAAFVIDPDGYRLEAYCQSTRQED